MKKIIKIAAIVAAVPSVILVLWLNTWMSFQFGFWADSLSGERIYSDGGGTMIGMLAFAVITAAEVFAAFQVYKEIG